MTNELGAAEDRIGEFGKQVLVLAMKGVPESEADSRVNALGLPPEVRREAIAYTYAQAREHAVLPEQAAQRQTAIEGAMAMSARGCSETEIATFLKGSGVVGPAAETILSSARSFDPGAAARLGRSILRARLTRIVAAFLFVVFTYGVADELKHGRASHAVGPTLVALLAFWWFRRLGKKLGRLRAGEVVA